MPEDEEILLPSAEQLEGERYRCTVDRVSQMIQHLPSPRDTRTARLGGDLIPLPRTGQHTKQISSEREEFTL